MLVTVALRYGAIGVQFVVLAILARHLSVDDYGRYMLVLGAVWSAYTLLGFGVSETFVREAPKRIQRNQQDQVAQLAGSALTVAILSAVLVGLLGAFCLWLFPLEESTATLLAFILAFLVAHGLVFNAAQLLLGIGDEQLGSFFYYPAINVSLLLTSVPYVVLAETPTFLGVATVTSLAGLAVAGISIALAVARTRPIVPKLASISLLVRVGIRLSISRALGYIGIWLPTFLAGVLLAPAQAGFLGTANRLAFAVGAVTAAVRFAVRPAIARAFDSDDARSIKQVCGRLASATFAVACIALFISVIGGEFILGIAFGPDLTPAAPLWTILLVGIAFEAFFGPVDEVLKMTGNEGRVLAVLAVAVAGTAVAVLLLAPRGVTAIAWVQVAYAVAIFGTMVVMVRSALGIWLHPLLPGSRNWPNSTNAEWGRLRSK